MELNKESFQANPVRLDISRSKITGLSHKHTTTFNAGKVIPLWAYSDILPGDTFKVDMSFAVRSTTPVAPVMDDLFLDVFWFFVPHKLVLSRQSMSPSVLDPAHSWEAFIGAQDSKLNMPIPGEVVLPQVVYDLAKYNEKPLDPDYFGTLVDYFGDAPAHSSSVGRIMTAVSALEYLAYYSVWNDYFRDPNTMNPVTFTIVDNYHMNVPEVVFSGGPFGSVLDNFDTLTAAPFHGYFGSALPWPQRNTETVTIPLDLDSDAPVHTANVNRSVLSDYPLRLNPVDGNSSANFTDVFSTKDVGTYGLAGGSVPSGVSSGLAPSNLVADLSSAASASVNAFRRAVQAQRWYEALARGGNRIDEMTQSMFGVTPSDAGKNRAEFLAARRIRLDVTQVNSTSGSTSESALQEGLGTTGAYSLTNDSSGYFTKSFDTWGTLLCVAVVRMNDTFHQGLPRRHLRRQRFDFYWPQFANLGEQTILSKELYNEGDYNDDSSEAISSGDTVFGYQEAWAEYRFEPNQVSGHLREDLKYWTYANYFSSAPTLPGFLNAARRIRDNVDRTLAVPSSVAGFQFLGDFYFDVTAVRPMPLYSIPGLVDHH